MGGIGSGRKPSVKTLVDRAYAIVDERLPELFSTLCDKAIAGDREAAIYLIDRRLGRPRQEIDQRTRVEISLGPADYAALARARTIEAQLAGVRLLEPGTVVEGEVVPHLEDEPKLEAVEMDGTDDDSVSEVTADNVH